MVTGPHSAGGSRQDDMRGAPAEVLKVFMTWGYQPRPRELHAEVSWLGQEALGLDSM